MENKEIKLRSGDVYQSQFGERVVVTGASETEVFYMWKDGQGDVKSIPEFLGIYHDLGRREDMTHLFNALDPAFDEKQPISDKGNVKTVLKELSGAELISGTRVGIDMKGIAHADDWERAYTVTLEEILGVALDMVPNILWLIPEYEAPKESVPPQEQNEQDVDQNEQEAAQPSEQTEAADEEASPENEAEDLEIEDVECAREAAKHEAEASKEETAETVKEEPAAAPTEEKKESKWTTYDGSYSEENVKHTSLHDLGKWAEYQGKALSTSQQNMVIKGMKEEGYSVAVISSVVRLAQQTIYNRLSKMRESEKAGE